MPTAIRPRPIVLVLDPGLESASILERAVERVALPHELVHVPTRRLLEDFLTAQGAFQGRRRVPPRLVLLDASAREPPDLDALRALRADPVGRFAPVVILAASPTDDQIRDAYEAGANSLIARPDTEEELFEAVVLVVTYWLGLNLLAGGVE